MWLCFALLFFALSAQLIDVVSCWVCTMCTLSDLAHPMLSSHDMLSLLCMLCCALLCCVCSALLILPQKLDRCEVTHANDPAKERETGTVTITRHVFVGLAWLGLAWLGLAWLGL